MQAMESIIHLFRVHSLFIIMLNLMILGPGFFIAFVVKNNSGLDQVSKMWRVCESYPHS